MSYKFDGEEFILLPTTGRWMPREMLGVAGSGHPIYPGVREFELTWQLNSPTGTYQLQKWFDALIATGTAVVDLPKYGDAEYVFESYTGCVLREPQFSQYFTENIQTVTMRITNIKT